MCVRRLVVTFLMIGLVFVSYALGQTGSQRYPGVESSVLDGSQLVVPDSVAFGAQPLLATEKRASKNPQSDINSMAIQPHRSAIPLQAYPLMVGTPESPSDHPAPPVRPYVVEPGEDVLAADPSPRYPGLGGGPTRAPAFHPSSLGDAELHYPAVPSDRSSAIGSWMPESSWSGDISLDEVASSAACFDGCGPLDSSPALWYAGSRALSMKRDRSHNVWLTLDGGNLPVHLLDSRDASMPWKMGVEAYMGRVFNCGESAVEVRYWGIFSNLQEASVLQTAAAGNFDTPLDFTPLFYDNGAGGGAVAVGDYFLNAEIHRVQRSFEIYNLEINFLRLVCSGGSACDSSCGPPNVCSCGQYDCNACDRNSTWQIRWIAGARYMLVDEKFQFATDRDSIVFGDNPDEELFYDIDVANHLVGGQIGCRIDRACMRRFSLHSDTKLGIFANHIRHHQFFGGANGAATVNDVGGPFNGQAYQIWSTKQDISMIAELDLGIDFMFNLQWSTGFGYRAVGVTGAALSTDQIPRFFEHLDGARKINSTGSILLHGAYWQAEYVW